MGGVGFSQCKKGRLLHLFLVLTSFTGNSVYNKQRVLNDLKMTGFLVVVRLAPLPHPPYPLFCHQVASLSQSSCMSPFEPRDGRGEGGGAKSDDSEKAWSSIIHSLLFCDLAFVFCCCCRYQKVCSPYKPITL
jgi:hypothetical protein